MRPRSAAIEVSRALVAAANARRVDAHAVRAVIAIWLESVTVEALTLDSRLIRRGADVAFEIGHPLADCRYLALAIECDCDLATCDAKFHAKAAPVYPRVKLLSDFAT